MNTISDLLNEVKFDEPQSYKNLSMYPLMSDNDFEIDFVPFFEAIDNDFVEIIEASNADIVTDLNLINKSPHRFLILDGEELPGQEQNFVANSSVMVPANKTITIPVSSHELDRWILEADDIRDAGRTRFVDGRTVSANESLRKPDKRLGRLENSRIEIFDMPQAKAPDSTSESIEFENKSLVEEYQDNFYFFPGHIGALFIVNEEVAGLDIFDTGVIYSLSLGKLIDHYAKYAIGLGSNRRRKSAYKSVTKFLADLKNANVEKIPGAGDGYNLRINEKGFVGGALVVDDRIVHLRATPTAEIVDFVEYRSRLTHSDIKSEEPAYMSTDTR